MRPLRNVMRLGTNSRLVGNRATGCTLIAPGPDDAVHLLRLYDATGGHIDAIVCTHSYPDHSSCPWSLQAMCIGPLTGRDRLPQLAGRGECCLQRARH